MTTIHQRVGVEPSLRSMYIKYTSHSGCVQHVTLV